MEECKIKNMYDLNHTIAKEYILKISVEIFFNHTLERKHALSKKVASAI